MVTCVSEGSWEMRVGIMGLPMIFIHINGSIGAFSESHCRGWLYGVSHVFSASMPLLVPLWFLSLCPMRRVGSPAGTGKVELASWSTSGGRNFLPRTHSNAPVNSKTGCYPRLLVLYKACRVELAAE